MALQAIDRAKIKHTMKVNKRKTPTLVNRTNKSVLVELVPHHILVSRFMYGWTKNIYRQY